MLLARAHFYALGFCNTFCSSQLLARAVTRVTYGFTNAPLAHNIVMLPHAPKHQAILMPAACQYCLPGACSFLLPLHQPSVDAKRCAFIARCSSTPHSPDGAKVLRVATTVSNDLGLRPAPGALHNLELGFHPGPGHQAQRVRASSRLLWTSRDNGNVSISPCLQGVVCPGRAAHFRVWACACLQWRLTTDMLPSCRS